MANGDNTIDLVSAYQTIDMAAAKTAVTEAFNSIESAMAHRKVHDQETQSWKQSRDPRSFEDYVAGQGIQGAISLRWQEFEQSNPDAAFFVEMQQSNRDFAKIHRLDVRESKPKF